MTNNMNSSFISTTHNMNSSFIPTSHNMNSSFISTTQSAHICLFVFVALRPMSTIMVIAGRSVHLTTLFPGQA